MPRSTSRCLLALLAAAAVVPGCAAAGGGGAADPNAAFEDAAAGPALRTEGDAYVVRYDRQFARVEIPFRYANRTRAPVYVPTCHGVHPPVLQKRVDDGWVTAYAPAVLACLGPPLVVQPGGLHADTLRVVAGLPGNDSYPKFDVWPVPGTYRLVWAVLGEPESDPLPYEERTSNEFRIDDPAR